MKTRWKDELQNSLVRNEVNIMHESSWRSCRWFFEAVGAGHDPDINTGLWVCGGRMQRYKHSETACSEPKIRSGRTCTFHVDRQRRQKVLFPVYDITSTGEAYLQL